MRLWIVLMAVSLFAACGGVEGKGEGGNTNNENNQNSNLPCLVDSDCSVDQVCEFEVCASPCIDSSTCGPSQACLPRDFGEGNFCANVMTSNNINNINNINNTNNLNNVNPNNADAYFIMQVRDITTEMCDADDPGADLVYVSLEESNGSVVAFGSLIDDGTTGDNNFYNLGINLDGTPPASSNECPDFTEESVTSLGCGGFVTLEFLNESGQRVGAVPDQQIRVFEFGTQCSTGSSTDEYDIYLCTDPSITPGSCTVNISGGSGEIVATVP